MPTKLMGIRIDENIIKKLEKMAENRNITPNQLVKLAINEWLDIIINARNQNMIIIEKVFFKRVLETIGEEELGKMTKDLADNFLNFTRLQLDLLKEKLSLKKFIPFLVKKLGKYGLMWLEHCDYEIRADKSVELKGNHSFNQIFSILLAAIIGYVMEELFNYVLIEEPANLSENTIELLFKPKYD